MIRLVEQLARRREDMGLKVGPHTIQCVPQNGETAAEHPAAQKRARRPLPGSMAHCAPAPASLPSLQASQCWLAYLQRAAQQVWVQGNLPEQQHAILMSS